MAEVAEIVALEMSKYLTKDASMAGVRKKINRSRAWVQHSQVKPDKVPGFCSECADEHAFSFVGPSARIEADYPGVNVAVTAGLAYYPTCGRAVRPGVGGRGREAPPTRLPDHRSFS